MFIKGKGHIKGIIVKNTTDFVKWMTKSSCRADEMSFNTGNSGISLISGIGTDIAYGTMKQKCNLSTIVKINDSKAFKISNI